MKKVSAERIIGVTSKRNFILSQKIDGLALIMTPDGKVGLYDLEKNEIVIEPGYYLTKIHSTAHVVIFVTKSHPKRVTIYGSKPRQFFIQNGFVVDSADGKMDFYVIYERKENVYRIFDLAAYKEGKDIFNTALDSVTSLTHSEYYPRVDYKTGIYVRGIGLIEPIQNDYIYYKDGKHLLERQNKWVVRYGNIRTAEFDRITLDKNNTDIVYCHDGETISIYKIFGSKIGKKQLVPITKIDALKVDFVSKSPWPTDFCGTYRFLVKTKEGMKAIETYVNNSKEFHRFSFISPEGKAYDRISVEGKTFFTVLDQKCGILISPSATVEPIYDKIESISSFYACYRDGLCDLIIASNDLKVAISGIRILERHDDDIVFEKDGKTGIITYNQANSSYIFGDYQIKHLGDGYYEITEDNLKGIYIKGKLIIPIENSSIEFYRVKKDTKHRDTQKHAYFALEKGPNSVSLARFTNHEQKPATRNFGTSPLYRRIHFLTDYILVETEDQVELFDYDTSSSIKLPSDTVVKEYPHNSTELSLYSIDDDYFNYMDGELVPAEITRQPIFQAAYEGEFGTVVVNATDMDDYNKKCAAIEALSDESFDDTLSTYYQTNNEVQENYPRLSLKIKK